jgi:cation diffusion facilitator CzcD-associated flavoprotein CzcO
MPLRRDVGYYANGDATNGIENLSLKDEPEEELDAVVVGAGFSGCKLLHELRKKGFKVKVVEAGSDLGGIWHWNQYPGARVDSQYPVYALAIPEVYNTWTWDEQYPVRSDKLQSAKIDGLTMWHRVSQS